MNQIFRSGEEAWLESSRQTCSIADFLGGGGQGEVYRVRIGNDEFALKWYFPNSATPQQRQSLEALVRIGPPASTFLWPIEMVSSEHHSGFGYLMPLRPHQYMGLVDVMNGQVDPSFRVLVNAALGLADSFLQLHAKGLCYCDISFGNIFFRSDNGAISICDNDNVGVDGETDSGVLGTPRFMAPEIVINASKPSTRTDLYSLSVLLFYMFMMHHPLEGRRESDIACLDLPAMQRLYGIDPIFIYDPEDETNRPVPGVHENPLIFWPLYPEFFRRIMVKAFTDGLKDPLNGRVRESEWRSALLRLRDSIFYCPHCRSENFFDQQRYDSGEAQICWSCQQETGAPLRLQFNRGLVVLNQDTKLYPHHLDATKRNDFSVPAGELAQHPKRPEVWGIKNLSEQAWVSTNATGQSYEVAPGRSVSIQHETRINFGNTEATIMARKRPTA